MIKTIVVSKADHNRTVEDLMKENPKFPGKNYLDLDTGCIVHIVEEPKTIIEAPKKRGRKTKA